MLADVSRHILGRTEGRGLGLRQLVRTHTGKCLDLKFGTPAGRRALWVSAGTGWPCVSTSDWVKSTI